MVTFSAAGQDIGQLLKYARLSLLLGWKVWMRSTYRIEGDCIAFTLAMDMPSMDWHTSVTSDRYDELIGLALAEQDRLLALCIPKPPLSNIIVAGGGDGPFRLDQGRPCRCCYTWPCHCSERLKAQPAPTPTP